MPAGSTYTPLASTTLTSAQSSVTFNSINSSYTDLVIVASAALTDNSGWNDYLRFNGISTTTYSQTNLYGDGTNPGTYRETGANRIQIAVGGLPTTASLWRTSRINIQNYSNSTTFKTVLTRSDSNDSGTGTTDAIVGLWRSTDAITSIVLYPYTSTYKVGSTFTLYGIQAA